MEMRVNYPDLFLQDALPFLDEVIYKRLDPIPPQYPQVFRVMGSTQSMEQTSEITGFGLARAIPENQPMQYDTARPGFPKNYIHTQYGLGFQVSRLAADDDKWGLVAKFGQGLGDSVRETIEIAAATVWNNAFSAGDYAGPDTKALCATDHPLPRGGTESNRLAVDSDLDVASLETALIQFRRMKNSSGLRRRLRPAKLVIPPDLEGTASEILYSTGRSDTANNATNWLKNRIGMPSFQGAFVYEFLTDTDAWFLMSQPEETELRFYWREKPNTVHNIDFPTRALQTAMWFRFCVGFSSFYGVLGTPGA